MISKGQEIYSKFYDTSLDLILEMTPGSLDLENNIEYTMICVATMNTGLNVEDSMNFTVAWSDARYYPNAEITFDDPVPSLQGPCDRSLKSEVPCGSCLNWR